MLVDLTVKEFLNKVVGSDPVPGGGSIAALNGAIASALAAMVANLTIGKKGYELHEELMRHISEVALRQKATFVEDIDRDSEAYDKVFACFKMPESTLQVPIALKILVPNQKHQRYHFSHFPFFLQTYLHYRKSSSPLPSYPYKQFDSP